MIERLKPLIRSNAPVLAAAWRRMRRFYAHARLAVMPPKQVFTEIFRGNQWGDAESVSGPGSNYAQTEVVREVLPRLLQELNCKTLLDVPCGDFSWMKLVEMECDYIGGDIVGELIHRNQQLYGSDKRRFMTLNLVEDELPSADVILTRDCLVHLSNRHATQAIRNIKHSGSTYLLATTFIQRERNEDIPTGSWRPINLQAPPFNFPTPVQLIDEECPVEAYRDKHLGLWRIDSIPHR